MPTTPKARAKKRPVLVRPVRPARKGKLTVDPTRLAMAALERIRGGLSRRGRPATLGGATPMRELAARASALGVVLPPSYSATTRAVAGVGEPERLLSAAEMQEALATIAARSTRHVTERAAPFATAGKGAFACFDRATQEQRGELAVVEWRDGALRPAARHFGEWLDAVADAREEALEAAAQIPEGLRSLLLELGFTFDDPLVGRVETGDVEAIEALLGAERTRQVRGNAGRLFDAGGKAALALDVDELTLAVTVRTGLCAFAAEDVFRWLRWFRDEGFYGEPARRPSHPDRARDLRLAPREPPLVQGGSTAVRCAPAARHHFVAAAGSSASDFYLLGRTSSTSDRSPSLLLHVVDGEVTRAQSLDEPLTQLHVTGSGVVWALSRSGSALRFTEGNARAFPLPRPGHGAPRWYGIGGAGDRVLAWGAGALLEHDGERFVPFSPAPQLEEHETVVAVCPQGKLLSMLVCGEGVGAVARFDGRAWRPIGEHDVIEGQLVDLDVWRGIGIVLGRSGDVWRLDEGAPRPVIWDTRQPAFIGPTGAPRATYTVRGFDGGAMLGSDGGVIVVGAGEPVFHVAEGASEPARLSRVGDGATVRSSHDRTPAVVALCGPHAWIWRYAPTGTVDRRSKAARARAADASESFWVIDVRDW